MKFTGLLLAAVSTVALAAPLDAAELRFATMVNEPHPWIDAAKAMKAEVEEKTGGEVTIEIFTGGSLGNDQTVLDEMRLGTIDLMMGGSQNAAPFVEQFGLFSLSYLFDGMDSFKAATAPDSAVTEYMKNAYKEAGLGLELLALSGGGTRNFSNGERPIEKPEDIDGLKMRVPGSQMDARMWQAFGALTTSLPWTELYTGVQTGVVDAFESTISGYYGSKLYEVAPYHALTGHQVMMSHITASDAAIAKLDDEQAAILREAASNAAMLGTEKGMEYDARLLDELVADHGVTVTEVDRAAFIAKVKPLHDEVAADLGMTDLLQTIRDIQG